MSIINSLNDLKKEIVSVAIIYGNVEFVIEDNEETGALTTVKITPLLGCSKTHIAKSNSRVQVIEFPEGFNTYAELLNDVWAFDKWYNENLKRYL